MLPYLAHTYTVENINSSLKTNGVDERNPYGGRSRVYIMAVAKSKQIRADEMKYMEKISANPSMQLSLRKFLKCRTTSKS
jgi:hypothetical protein